MNGYLKPIAILALMSISFMTAAADQFNWQPMSFQYGTRKEHLTPSSITSPSLFRNKLKPEKDIVGAIFQRNSFVLLSPGRYELNLHDVGDGVRIGGIIRKEGKIRSTKVGECFIFEWVRNSVQTLRLRPILDENYTLCFDRSLEDKPKRGKARRLPKSVSCTANNSTTTATFANVNNIQPEQQMSARYYANLANHYFQSHDLVTACRTYEIALALDMSILGEIDLQNLREIRAHFWGLATKKSNADKNVSSKKFNQEYLDLFSLCMASQKCFIALKGQKSTTDNYVFLADARYLSKHYTLALNYLRKSLMLSSSQDELFCCAMLYAQLGETSYRLKEFGNAIHYYECASAIDNKALTKADLQLLTECKIKDNE